MKTALFLGAGASAFASQPTTQKIMELVRESVQQHSDELDWDENLQNYIMRVIKDDTYADVEKLYDGIERVINITNNRNCKPIIYNIDKHDYGITDTRIISGLASLRSIIHQILRTSFVIDSDTSKSIGQMYDMILSVIKDEGVKEFQVFTTNYDLVMETYSERADLEIINGFKIYPYRKWIWANSWDRCTDKPPLYLIKMHGSIYWHKDADDKIVETRSVVDEDIDRYSMIAPTEGAKDYDREPFSALINRFRTAIKEVDILLVIGFSYRDEKIVDIIKEGLKNNMILISISPDAATSICRVLDRDVKPRQIKDQRFKAVGPRIFLYEQEFGLDTIDDVRKMLFELYMFINVNIQIQRSMHDRTVKNSEP